MKFTRYAKIYHKNKSIELGLLEREGKEAVGYVSVYERESEESNNFKTITIALPLKDLLTLDTFLLDLINSVKLRYKYAIDKKSKFENSREKQG